MVLGPYNGSRCYSNNTIVSQFALNVTIESFVPRVSGCEQESRLSMWIYVFLGNILRGIGETPVQPLGISYIDDHALEENAAFYIGIYLIFAYVSST